MIYQAYSSPIYQAGVEPENTTETRQAQKPDGLELGRTKHDIKELHQNLFENFQKKAQQFDKFRKVNDLFYFMTDKNALPLF